MYGITLSVTACLRSGTRADVVWLVDADGLPVPDWSDALVLTPGGGRIGSIAGGALDGQLADLAGRWNIGRLVTFQVSEIDALIAGLPTAGSAQCLVVPANAFPVELWEMTAARLPLCLVCRIEGGEVAKISLFSDDNIGEAGSVVEQLFQAGASGSTLIDDEVITVLRPVPQLVVVGDSPVGDALAELASLVGWKARVFNDAGSATGVIATLSPLDKVVVTAHDVDLAGAALLAALESEAGYIGALGAHRMQETRADWLAYRGVTDLSRIHGPAGIDIGAETPSEIAVSILAEAIGADVTDRVSD